MGKRFTVQVLASSAALLLLVASCAPAAPSPTAAPAKPAATAAPAKPAATQAPAAKPAASPAAKAEAKPVEKPAAKAPANPAGPFMAEDSAEWKAILEAGRREGEVTVYGSDTLGTIVEKLKPSFTEKYGIKVSYVGGSGSDTQERAVAEKDAGRRVASVVEAGDSNLYIVYQEGVLQELRGLPNGARLHPAMFTIFEESKLHYWPLYDLFRGLYVNTQVLPEAEAPKNWKDLIEPKWKGKIVMHDPGRSGGGNNFFTITIGLPDYGEDFHRKLAQQDLLRVARAQEVDAIVARGERAVGLPGNPRGAVRQRGSPIKFIPQADGTFGATHVMGLVKDAPAPSAGKIFLNWFISPEFQTEIAKDLLDMPLIMGIDHPMGLAIDKVKLLGPGRIPPTSRQDTAAQARAIYGR